ncbi:hypothetical protein [Actinomadura sp. GTD37]|uniref:hypothetical protein n=1 Tax=Actinomadura sp. GTD37 TaxID=1778030 RepID=UPI0035C05764
MATIETGAERAVPAASRPSSIPPVSAARRVAAIGSVLAAFAHYAVVPEHLGEWWAYGVFFSAIALFQLVWAVLVHTGSERAVLLSGPAVSLGVLALWAVSRTSGLPFGPDAGEAEAIGVLDVVSGAAELAVVAGALLALRGPRRKAAVAAGAEDAAGAEGAEEASERAG